MRFLLWCRYKFYLRVYRHYRNRGLFQHWDDNEFMGDFYQSIALDFFDKAVKMHIRLYPPGLNPHNLEERQQ